MNLSKFDGFVNKQYKLIVLILLFIFFIQATLCSLNEAPVYDSMKHYDTGLLFLNSGECCDGTDNTPMTVLNAVFGKIASKILRVDIKSREALFFAKLPNIFLGLILGLFIFLFSKRLFSLKAALFSLFVFSFSPNMLCHSRLLAQDLPGACFILVSTYFFFKFLDLSSMKNILLSGLTLGIAFLSKLSSFLLIPIFLIMFFVYFIYKKEKKNLKRAFFGIMLIFLISLFIFNAGYFFDGTFSRLDKDLRSPFFTKLTNNSFFSSIPIPLPKPAIRGLDWISFNCHYSGWSAYFIGKYSQMGWVAYFPVAFLIKTPIPTLIFFLVSLGMMIKKRKINELILLIPFLFFFLYNIFFNHMNIGLRHILMVYPFMFVIIGKMINYSDKLKYAKYVIFALMLWLVFAAFLIYPYHCEYFNEIIGPKNGYKYLADSNLDWGQDNYYIEKYIKNSDKIIIENPGCSYVYGFVAVNVNNLVGIFGDKGECYSWIRRYPVIDRVAYTWFIFDARNKTIE